MAIATKQIAAGILVKNESAISYARVSKCSDWFESRFGTGTGDANAMAVSVALDVALLSNTGPDPLDLMRLHVFESDDLKEWDYVAQLSGTATDTKLYSFAWEYGGTRKKYLRVEFSIDDEPWSGGLPSIPYPFPGAQDIEFRGTCWVTTYYKRP